MTVPATTPLEVEEGYVSQYLTHFVGRAKPMPEQFALLKRILERGWLCHSPFREQPTLGIEFHPGRRFADNDMIVPEMICFCDIPLSHLKIHTRKYSQFGIAFSKPWVIARGANPVLYVAKNSGVLRKKPEHRKPADRETISPEEYAKRKAEPLESEHFGLEPRGDVFEEYMRLFWELWYAKQKAAEAGPGDALLTLLQQDRSMWMFLMPHLLGYVKVFDDSLPLDDANNFYMEREWRKLGNLQFATADVAAVLVPPDMVNECRRDCSAFADRVQGLPSWEESTG